MWYEHCSPVVRKKSMWRKHGSARNWPFDAQIFDGEGIKFRKFVSKRGWTKDHIPIWCQEAIEARARAIGGPKKPPPTGFYHRTSSRSDPNEPAEHAFMCFSAYITGLRWIDDRLKPAAWCTKHEYLTEMCHYDQIWQPKKSTKR